MKRCAVANMRMAVKGKYECPLPTEGDTSFQSSFTPMKEQYPNLFTPNDPSNPGGPFYSSIGNFGQVTAPDGTLVGHIKPSHSLKSDMNNVYPLMVRYTSSSFLRAALL